MLTDTVETPVATTMIPRTTIASLLDLAQQAFAEGYAPLGEQLIDLVHESFQPDALPAYR